MSQFIYKAKQGPSKIIDGVIEADTIDSAINKINKLGFIPIDVIPAIAAPAAITKKIKRIEINIFKKVGSKDVILFTRQMTDLIEASVPILRSLQIVANQTSNIAFKQIVQSMFEHVKNGGSFSSALSQYSEIFPGFYTNMVKTGEVGGKLDIVMKRLAGYLEQEQQTKNKVVSSLAYPFLIFIVGIITVIVLLTFVIPKLSGMFDDLNQQLPWPTLVLLNISGFLGHYWWVVCALSLALGLYVYQWINSEKGRRQFDLFQLKVPILGQFIKMIETARFSRTMATLIESGVVITTALEAVTHTITNVILQEEIRKVAEDVKAGAGLKAALKQCRFFPEMAFNMIAVGEETGHLERGLYKVAETFERESDEISKTIISLLGPLVLIVIVSVVGFMVIAMLLPIFKMNLLVQ